VFVLMKDYDTGCSILINRDRIIKVEHGYNFVKLYFNKDDFFKVQHSLKEAQRILNGESKN